MFWLQFYKQFLAHLCFKIFQGDAFRFNNHRPPPRVPQSPRRFSRGGNQMTVLFLMLITCLFNIFYHQWTFSYWVYMGQSTVEYFFTFCLNVSDGGRHRGGSRAVQKYPLSVIWFDPIRKNRISENLDRIRII